MQYNNCTKKKKRKENLLEILKRLRITQQQLSEYAGNFGSLRVFLTEYNWNTISVFLVILKTTGKTENDFVGNASTTRSEMSRNHIW